MNQLFALIGRLASQLSLTLAGFSITLLFILSLSEIIARNIFGSSIDLAQEYTGYLVANAFIMGSGWTLAQHGHIRIALLSDRLPPHLSRVLGLWATALGLCLSIYMAHAMINYALQSFVRHETSYFPSATALVWPQSALAFGFILLCISFLIRLVSAIKGEPS